MEALWVSMARRMAVGFARLKDWPAERCNLMAAHTAIAEKILAGDGEAAAAVRDHIRGFNARVLEKGS